VSVTKSGKFTLTRVGIDMLNEPSTAFIDMMLSLEKLGYERSGLRFSKGGKVKLTVNTENGRVSVVIFGKEALLDFIKIVGMKEIFSRYIRSKRLYNVILEISADDRDQFRLIRGIASRSSDCVSVINNFSPSLEFKMSASINRGKSLTNFSKIPLLISVVKKHGKPLVLSAGDHQGISLIEFNENERVLPGDATEEFLSYGAPENATFYGVKLTKNVTEPNIIIGTLYEMMSLLSGLIDGDFVTDTKNLIARIISESRVCKEMISALTERYREFVLSRRGYPLIFNTLSYTYIYSSYPFVSGVLKVLRGEYEMSVSETARDVSGCTTYESMCLRERESRRGEIHLRHVFCDARGRELSDASKLISKGRGVPDGACLHDFLKRFITTFRGRDDFKRIVSDENYTLNAVHDSDLKWTAISPISHGFVVNQLVKSGFSTAVTGALKKVSAERRSVGLSMDNFNVLLTNRVVEYPFNIDMIVFFEKFYEKRVKLVMITSVPLRYFLGNAVTEAELDGVLSRLQWRNTKYVNEVIYRGVMQDQDVRG